MIAGVVHQFSYGTPAQVSGGNQHVADIKTLGQGARFVECADHGDTVDSGADAPRVGGNEPYDMVGQRTVALNRPQQLFARVVGADNQRRDVAR